MAAEQNTAQSTSRSCPYCEGKGCSECGDTGVRVTTHMQTEDGISFRVSGNAVLDAEAQAALAEVARAAHAQMGERGPNTNPMGNGGPCMSCGGNDGYGPAPHHTPECYFASNEDAEHAA